MSCPPRGRSQRIKTHHSVNAAKSRPRLARKAFYSEILHFTFCYYCQQFNPYLLYDQQFLFTVGLFVHLLVPFGSCIMYPDSSGKLIRLVHICQPASFSLATALKVLNTKIYLHKISLLILPRLQCNLQQQFQFCISKRGILLGWKTRDTGKSLWKTYWITAHTDGWVKQNTKKIQCSLTNLNSRPLKSVTQQQMQNVVVVTSKEVDYIFLNS